MPGTTLFTLKLNNSCTGGNHTKTNLRLTRTTQMAQTHTNKPELGAVVCEEFYISLDAGGRLNKHRTGAPPSYTPLVLRPPPHDRIAGDPRVYELAVHEPGVTCVVNGVRHTSLRDTLTRRDD